MENGHPLWKTFLVRRYAPYNQQDPDRYPSRTHPKLVILAEAAVSRPGESLVLLPCRRRRPRPFFGLQAAGRQRQTLGFMLLQSHVEPCRGVLSRWLTFAQLRWYGLLRDDPDSFRRSAVFTLDLGVRLGMPLPNGQRASDTEPSR